MRRLIGFLLQAIAVMLAIYFYRKDYLGVFRVIWKTYDSSALERWQPAGFDIRPNWWYLAPLMALFLAGTFYGLMPRRKRPSS